MLGSTLPDVCPLLAGQAREVAARTPVPLARFPKPKLEGEAMKEREMRPAVMEWCIAQSHVPVCEVFVWTHTADIVAAKYAERVGRRVPPLESLIGIELKLNDIPGVIKQCVNLHRHTNQVYAAMPASRVKKMKQRTLDQFLQARVGLLAVRKTQVKVIINSFGLLLPSPDEWQRQSMEKKLWRRIVSGNTHVTEEQREARYRYLANYHDSQCSCKWCLILKQEANLEAVSD